ncbi:MAG TPA: hypothetical protein PKX78_01115 [Candidatus Woesebacteria bacterium]|nr:hypothetical protein [Candidatus Woesebacteria bacterium]
MKFVLKLFTFLIIIGLGLVPFFAPTPAHAQTKQWDGVCVGSSANATGVATIQGFECLIANIFVVFITVIGLAGFVMFIYASFRWLISGGDTKGTQAARNTMTYSVIGLVVALSAFIIINLVAEFTGINAIKSFRIPTSNINWTQPPPVSP